MDIDPSESSNWIFYDRGVVVDPFPLTAFNWPSPQEAYTGCSDPSVGVDFSFGDLDSVQVVGSCKRLKYEAGSSSGSKACREKLRRDKLNERFLELSSVLDPERPLRTDKVAILSDAIQMVIRLRSEAQKLKQMNKGLQSKIEELKAEKNELRDEKLKLKAKKEKLEQKTRALSTQARFMPQSPAISAEFAAQQQASGPKLLPFIGYPGVAMWQFLPPAVVDTSQDHVLRPPVA